MAERWGVDSTSGRLNTGVNTSDQQSIWSPIGLSYHLAQEMPRPRHVWEASLAGRHYAAGSLSSVSSRPYKWLCRYSLIRGSTSCSKVDFYSRLISSLFIVSHPHPV